MNMEVREALAAESFSAVDLAKVINAAGDLRGAVLAVVNSEPNMDKRQHALRSLFAGDVGAELDTESEHRRRAASDESRANVAHLITPKHKGRGGDGALRKGESFASRFGTVDEDEMSEFYRSAYRGGNEFRATQIEGTDNLGGYLVDEQYASNVIDLAREQVRLMEAGSVVYPMATDTLNVGTIDGDPSPDWHQEAAAITQDDYAIGRVVFATSTIALVVRASRELVEDSPNLGSVISGAMAKKFAVSLESAALYGAVDGPTGLKATVSAQSAADAATLAAVDYDYLAGVILDIQGANYEPSAVITSPTHIKNLAVTKATGGSEEYLAPPRYVGSVPILGTDLMATTGANEAVAFVGDFGQTAFGIRKSFGLQVLRERYADTGEVGFLGWLRADFQVLRPTAVRKVQVDA